MRVWGEWGESVVGSGVRVWGEWSESVWILYQNCNLQKIQL